MGVFESSTRVFSFVRSSLCVLQSHSISRLDAYLYCYDFGWMSVCTVIKEQQIFFSRAIQEMHYLAYTQLCLLITLLLPHIVLSSSALCVDFIETQTMLVDLIAQKN